MSRVDWLRTLTPRRCVEWFIVANIAFLGVDIGLAHSENDFRQGAEWTPLGFSFAATCLLLPMLFGQRHSRWYVVERWVGVGTIAIGVLGMLFHLRSAFFRDRTLHSLVYSAPFVAPLAYVGVGLLLLLVRSEAAQAPEFGPWLTLLALAGFGGNWGMALLDHAQNGFFYRTEWIPVVTAAFAFGFLLVVWLRPGSSILRATSLVLALASAVGVLGSVLHLVADLRQPAPLVLDRLRFGAPAFAPLLFTDLAALAALGLWQLSRDRHASCSTQR